MGRDLPDSWGRQGENARNKCSRIDPTEPHKDEVRVRRSLTLPRWKTVHGESSPNRASRVERPEPHKDKSKVRSILRKSATEDGRSLTLPMWRTVYREGRPSAARWEGAGASVFRWRRLADSLLGDDEGRRHGSRSLQGAVEYVAPALGRPFGTWGFLKGEYPRLVTLGYCRMSLRDSRKWDRGGICWSGKAGISNCG
jgi:hypothetical protein